MRNGRAHFSSSADRDAAARELRSQGVRGIHVGRDYKRQADPFYLYTSHDQKTLDAMLNPCAGARYVPNPTRPGGRKRVELISDRAKRYRANQPGVQPAAPRRCLFCGSTSNVGVHHLDGNESNGRRDNLSWACKSCNASLAYAFKAAGLGKRTRQMNPAGAETLQQYAWAIGHICRHRDQAAGACSPSDDPIVLEAVELIRATPAARRREFARQAAGSRRRGGFDVF